MPEITQTDSSPEPPYSGDAHDANPPLLQLLTRLIDRLTALRDGDPPAAGHGPALDRWEDNAYVYLEAILPSSSDLDIDISGHGGRVFIRIVR